MEGMVNLNITDTQRASNLSKNLSSILKSYIGTKTTYKVYVQSRLMAILSLVRDFGFHLIVLTFWKTFLALFVNYNKNSLKA